MSVSVANRYSEDQLMHIFLSNFHQGGKYTAQISIHQEELRRLVNFTGQKDLSISSLHTDYLNIYSSLGSVRNNEIANIILKKCTFCGGAKHSAENILKR